MQTASHDGVGFLNAGGEMKEARDRHLAEVEKAWDVELQRPEEERRATAKSAPDMNAPFPSQPYLQWLYGTDVIAEARRYLAGRKEQVG